MHINCRATIGEVGNEEHSLESVGKAGRMRWRGVRPTVRGVAMNPVDHPHGGGEGKKAAARGPGFAVGCITKGYKTRKNKRTDAMIIRRRNDGDRWRLIPWRGRSRRARSSIITW